MQLLSCVKGGAPAQAEPSPLFSPHFFSYLKCSFPLYIMYVRCLEEDTSPVCLSTKALVRIISTSVSIKSDRSQGSKPTSQVPHGNCWSYLLLEEDDSIIVCCHVPHQTPAQQHGASQKADVSPWGKSCIDKTKDLWRNSLLNGAGETHVHGNGLSPSLTGSPAQMKSLYVWLILFPCTMMECAFFAPLLLVCLISY